MKILIATPMYGGMCTGEYTKSMIAVPTVLKGAGHEVSFAFLMNNSLIPSARNTLANIFIKNDFTHMMFIDADISFNAADIVSMINADKPIIAGIYPKKEINWERVEMAVKTGVPMSELKNHTGSLVVYLSDKSEERKVPKNEPTEVKGAGTGFMLIKKEVMEQLSKHTEKYIDSNDQTEINEFFFTMKNPESGMQLSEDFAFCYMCKHYGIKMYIAPWVKLGHTGTYTFEGSVIPVVNT